MREVPISCGLLALPPVRGKAVALGNRLRYFASVFNGSYWLVMTGRDTDATWRTLGTLCRERDWSKPRALYELQNGLPYRTIPPGHTIDWHHPQVKRTLDDAASPVMIVQTVLMADGVPDLDRRTIGIEVLPPADAEVPPASATVEWARATTRKPRTGKKIREGATKAELARLLEAEAREAVKTGQISRALKACYM